MVYSYAHNIVIAPSQNGSEQGTPVRLQTVKMSLKFACLLMILGVISPIFANEKVLVLVDNWSIRETHSIFFKSLRGMYIISIRNLEVC